MDNSEETNKKQCIICDKFQSPQKKMMSLFSDKEHICLECYAEQNQMIVQYKKGRPMLYPDYNLIIENLYLGNEDTAIDQQVIKKENIRAILVCGSFLMTPFQETQMEGEFEKICYRKLDIADFPSQKLVHLFDQTLQWIHEMRKSGRNILIHCAAGVSRSSSFTIAYLMKYEQLTFQQAYQLVKQKRKIIRPNSGFINQLKQYEKILQNKQ